MASEQGIGFIVHEDGRELPVSYTVDHWESPRSRGSTGRLTGDLGSLNEAFDDPEVTLRLADGREAPVEITDFHPAMGSRFSANAPFP